MSNIFRFTILLVALVFIALSVNAQSGNNSPYSRFGLGDLTDNNSMHIRQMGGAAAAYADVYHINITNPASYSFLRATSFEIGMGAQYSNYQESNGESQGLWSGNLQYLTLAFPLRNPLNEAFEREKKNWRIGMGFALLPSSEVAYNITTSDSDPNIGAFERNFSGTGGTWKFLWGNSIKYNNLAFGVHLGYMFGAMEYQRNLNFIDLENAFDNSFSSKTSLNGFVWNSGAIYQIFLNQDDVEQKRANELKFVNVGIFGNSATSFSTTTDYFDRNISRTGLFQDTLRNDIDIEGSGQLPAEFGFGATYYKGTSLSLGFQYSTTNWSQYKNDANPEELSDTYKLSFGGYYRPNYKSFKFRDRIFYRYGVFYNTDPISNEQEQLKNYGLTFGFGLPFLYQRKISHMNIGFTLGRRNAGDVLRENYIKIGVSFNFNDDEWFIQRKYN